MTMSKQQHKVPGTILFLTIIALSAATVISSCQEESYTPKPRSFHRIDVPDKEYQIFRADYCPCTFNFPTYGSVDRKVVYFKDTPDHPCWLNIDLPYFNGKIYMSYTDIDSEEKLERVINDAYKYAFKHTIKADFIDETPVRTNELSGVLFDIGGNVATNVQFYVTDSSQHYLRGSLYFDEQPNVDSLRPVIDFLRLDMLELMRSVNWES